MPGSPVVDLDREAVKRGLADGSILLVDVREPHEFAAGHIPGSVSMPLSTFDPDAIPAPYNHSNVMSDEVIYYASSEFMSRKAIEYGSVTLHPDGVPHGPHPGRTEASIGAKRTDELAVMLDTHRPLRRTPPE